ncbi:HTTM domain-containing protein [Flexithrix dorotheae]|uniref:HTTM domain-containing protein n=1 Tax=Flexithrix dorotheae TaxID=70993 RepID=UPI0012F7E8C7|nr:hypothetical protein [Flexithrix dorotheae]
MRRILFFLCISLVIIIIANLFFFLVLKPEIQLLFKNQSSPWFAQFIDWFYPRFKTESHRFHPEFFFEKAFQVILRFDMVSLSALASIYIFSKSKKLESRRKVFWNGQMSPDSTGILTRIFYLGMIGYTLDWFQYLNDYYQLKEFYNPVFLYQIFNIPFPNPIAITFMIILFWGSCIFAILQIKPFVSSAVASLLFILILGFLQSFEKINHGYATFGFASLIMPFLVLEKERVRIIGEKLQKNWPLKLIQMTIGLAYLFSGLEKILISGFSWTSGDTFSGYLSIGTEGILRQFLLNHPLLVIIFANGVLIFQLTFWIIIFNSRLRWFYLLLGIIFHWGTILALEVGTWNSPWIFVYIFFLPFDEMINKDWVIFKKLKRI